MTEPPVRTPVGSAKSLQLTPIWEEVVRNRRVPSDIAVSEILREIRSRLRAGEWEVRQHALRVLADVLPVAGELVELADLQAALVCNLGSPAPGVRKAASDALIKLLKILKNAEQEILNLLGGCNDENVTLGIIIALPEILRPFVFPENGGYVLSSHCLTVILTYLVNRVSIPIYRDASVEALMKIRDICGDVRFQNCVQSICPDPKTLQLLTLNLDDSGIDLKFPSTVVGIPNDSVRDDDIKSEITWSDNSDGEIINSVTTFHNYERYKQEGSSEDGYSDGSDETYTKESSEPGKILLETEIQLSEQRALTMRIMEGESLETEHGVIFEGSDGHFVSADGSLVMAVVPSSDDESARRTPRRVRFGGEVIKLCTPDSDATDVRIEIEGSSEHPVERLIIERTQKNSSQIPLPIAPATSRPVASSESVRLQTMVAEFPDEKRGEIIQSPPQIKVSPSTDDEETDKPLELNSGAPEKLDSEPSSASKMESDPDVQKEELVKEDGIERPMTATKRATPDRSQVVVSPITQTSSDGRLWETLQLLDYSNMAALKAKDDWKLELTALEQLQRNLQLNHVQERLTNSSTNAIREFLHFLLDNPKPQTVETALYSVRQIVILLPLTTVKVCLEDLVSGLCRHIGSSSPGAKMAAADILRLLFSRIHSSDILDVLLGNRCLHSSSSKVRENSLLALLHALMTYPSTTFPHHRLLEATCKSAADLRRRVRHASLEALSVLAQFLSTSEILECASKIGPKSLVAAVSTRLARRSLPSVSSEGLVLYALQIPSARRLGHLGPPQGADVDWILSGTGSLSTGSARSRGQLQNAQNARWVGDNNVVHKTARENPWTAQKNRTEDGVAWALVPVSALDDGTYPGTDQNFAGTVRPFYVKFAGPDDLRSQRYAMHRVGDAKALGAPIRVLTPSVHRAQTESRASRWSDSRSRDVEVKDARRVERSLNRKIVETPRPILVSSTPISHVSTPPAALFLPNIHSHEKARSLEKATRAEETFPATNMEKHRFAEPVSPSTVSQNVSQNFPAVTAPPESASKIRSAPLTMEEIIPLPPCGKGDVQDNPAYRKPPELGSERKISMTSASAPPAITVRDRDSASSSSTLDSCGIPETKLRNDRLRHSNMPLEVSSNLSYCSLNESYNQKTKTKRKAVHMNGKVANSTSHFADNLKPFERPREGLETCFTQLDAQQWEVAMQGLTSLIRLVRHHPTTAAAHVHPLVAALSKQIRNLRSQVSRAACQASGEMFTTLKKAIEPELEEIAGALFHRTADTNRFIQADSNAALDAMIESITPSKSILVIVAKGAGHHNAIAKTTAARLLHRLSEKLGPDKIITLPKDVRDRMINAGASLLMEGRLETRSFAKQLFRVLQSNSQLSAIVNEIIPANIMRHIGKTLATLRP